MPLPAASAKSERDALALFDATLDLEPSERDARLASCCAHDPALLARVRALLAADAAGTLLPAAASALTGATRTAALLPPPQVGPYRLEELIGSGGMGAVYRASRNDGLFDQTVAIKFVRPLAGRVQVEALVDAERRLLARMQHPGIARILDGGTTAEGLHYLVMEYVDGTALDVHVREHTLDPRERVALLHEACDAVAHAHQHLVLHCDIKPANILVTGDGRAKLIDFGVARIQDAIDPALPPGFTRAYTSPQRLAGEPPSVSDDVYALGMVLVELLGGELPASAADVHARGMLDAELAAIARKAVADERDARYASVHDFGDDLLNWLAQRPVAALAPLLRYRARKLVQRHPWRVAALALAGLGLIVALAAIATLYARAETARREAERRFAEVRSLANYMLFDLDARLESTPGTTPARRELVEHSQQYLDTLARTAGDNPALQREIAVGLGRLAEIQGGWGLPNLGEAEHARASFERAERMLAALVQRRPDEWTWRRDLARVQQRLADFYGGNDNDVRKELAKALEAEAHLQRAMATAGAGLAPREQAELDGLLSSIRLTQAFALDWTDDARAGTAIAEREEARLLALPEAVKREMAFDHRAGRAAMLLGDSLFYLDRFEDALAAYGRARQRFAQGLALTPRHRALLESSALAHWSASSALTELGRHAEALAEIDLALPLGAQLLELDPGNVSAQRMRSTLRNHRALILGRLARYDEAIALVQSDLLERAARVARAPDASEPARDAAVPLHPLAELYWKKGDTAAACAASRRAVDAWAALDRRWGLSALDRRQSLEAAQTAAQRCPG